MAGKGDSYRPVNKQRFDANYDAIFRKEEPHATAPKANSYHGDDCPVCGEPDCAWYETLVAPATEAPVRSGPREVTYEDLHCGYSDDCE